MPARRFKKLVPATGLEPVRCYSLEPESSASANSATRALGWPILPDPKFRIRAAPCKLQCERLFLAADASPRKQIAQALCAPARHSRKPAYYSICHCRELE